MSSTEIKEVLIKRIEQADEKLLRMLFAMVEIYR